MAGGVLHDTGSMPERGRDGKQKSCKNRVILFSYTTYENAGRVGAFFRGNRG
jgi:hypothetical protein